MLEKFKSVGSSLSKKAKSGAGKAAATARSRNANKDDDYLVALDIGTEFVKALIGKVNVNEGTVEIVGVGRAHQALTDMQAGAISDIAGVVENCDKALNKAEEQAGVSVRSAIKAPLQLCE
jgi:cell division ATPase FtsA